MMPGYGKPKMVVSDNGRFARIFFFLFFRICD